MTQSDLTDDAKAPRPAPILTTERLTIRRIVAEDAPFVRALANDPGFLENIGDRGVHSDADAARYIAERYTAHYAEHGYGIYLVEAGGVPIGTCGFVRREGLPAPDLGYAYLAAHTRQGYGREAAEAMLRHGRETLGLGAIVAFVGRGNAASAALLRRLGFVEDGEAVVPGYPGGNLLFRHASPEPPDRLGAA
ncbi:MAG: family acetyltransferase [Sphingomonas bacterium]|nr:GNAT family N-acetyltransferase [Sphingomonas bacterium]MDB5690610.1 family acetyltransferase [Sphingomonas bacterium]